LIEADIHGGEIYGRRKGGKARMEMIILENRLRSRERGGGDGAYQRNNQLIKKPYGKRIFKSWEGEDQTPGPFKILRGRG